MLMKVKRSKKKKKYLKNYINLLNTLFTSIIRKSSFRFYKFKFYKYGIAQNNLEIIIDFIIITMDW